MINKIPRKRVTCPECKGRFLKRRTGQKFCSADCRIQNWLKLHPRINLANENQKGE
jgi:endogenous inhibitor of DNA gyrase (YacG/DUF329 family)